MNEAKYIGLDVHQATISVSILDSSGKLVMPAILETKAETILQFMRGLRGSLHVTLDDVCLCYDPTTHLFGSRFLSRCNLLARN